MIVPNYDYDGDCFQWLFQWWFNTMVIVFIDCSNDDYDGDRFQWLLQWWIVFSDYTIYYYSHHSIGLEAITFDRGYCRQRYYYFINMFWLTNRNSKVFFASAKIFLTLVCFLFLLEDVNGRSIAVRVVLPVATGCDTVLLVRTNSSILVV